MFIGSLFGYRGTIKVQDSVKFGLRHTVSCYHIRGKRSPTLQNIPDIMNTEEFKRIAKETIDYVCKYRTNYNSLKVYPGEDITVGYLKKRISSAYTPL